MVATPDWRPGVFLGVVARVCRRGLYGFCGRDVVWRRCRSVCVIACVYVGDGSPSHPPPPLPLSWFVVAAAGCYWQRARSGWVPLCAGVRVGCAGCAERGARVECAAPRARIRMPLSLV